MERLTPTFADLDTEYADDSLILYCMNIEEALLKLGAEPGKDYTYKDLMGWAIELIKPLMETEDVSKQLKFDWMPKNPR
jgi:hypothetical protein